MDPSIARDLVERLTSRKFILTLVVILLAVVGYMSGQLDYGQFVNTVLFAVGIFSGVEGLADAAGALKGRPTPPSVNTTNVNVESKPPADPPLARGPGY